MDGGVPVDMLRLCVGSINVTSEIDRPLDYYLITNEPWFVRSPIEASVISIQKTGDEGQEVRQEPVPAPPQGSRALLCVE
jgi:hypothetical protein